MIINDVWNQSSLNIRVYCFNLTFQYCTFDYFLGAIWLIITVHGIWRWVPFKPILLKTDLIRAWSLFLSILNQQSRLFTPRIKLKLLTSNLYLLERSSWVDLEVNKSFDKSSVRLNPMGFSDSSSHKFLRGGLVKREPKLSIYAHGWQSENNQK